MLRSLCCGAVVCCLVGLLIIDVLVCFGVLLLFVFLFVCVCSLFLALLFLCICSKSLPRGNQVDGLPRASHMTLRADRLKSNYLTCSIFEISSVPILVPFLILFFNFLKI